MTELASSGLVLRLTEPIASGSQLRKAPYLGLGGLSGGMFESNGESILSGDGLGCVMKVFLAVFYRYSICMRRIDNSRYSDGIANPISQVVYNCM